MFSALLHKLLALLGNFPCKFHDLDTGDVNKEDVLHAKLPKIIPFEVISRIKCVSGKMVKLKGEKNVSKFEPKNSEILIVRSFFLTRISFYLACDKY